MTSKRKYKLICPTQFGSARYFLFNKTFWLGTPWILNLQFKSFLVVSSERVGHKNNFLGSGFLEFWDLSKLLVRLWATSSSRGRTIPHHHHQQQQQQLGAILQERIEWGMWRLTLAVMGWKFRNEVGKNIFVCGKALTMEWL